MSSPVKRIIRGVQGDDWFALGFGWSYIPEGETEAVAVVLSDAKWQFKRKATDEEAIVSLTPGDGIDEDALAVGRVMPTLTPEQTRLLSTGVWDCEATSDGGQVKTLATGNYIFDEDVSR